MQEQCNQTEHPVRRRDAPPGDHVVYRLMARDGAVIYIGSTADLAARLAWHRDKPWADYAAERAANRVEAEGREAVAILTERPPFNGQTVVHGGPSALAAAARRAGLLTPALSKLAGQMEAEAGRYPGGPHSRQLAAIRALLEAS